MLQHASSVVKTWQKHATNVYDQASTVLYVIQHARSVKIDHVGNMLLM